MSVLEMENKAKDLRSQVRDLEDDDRDEINCDYDYFSNFSPAWSAVTMQPLGSNLLK